MVRIRDICSMTDFSRHRTEHLAQLLKSGRPRVLTVNGRPVLVVQSATAYEELMDAAARSATVRARPGGRAARAAGVGMLVLALFAGTARAQPAGATTRPADDAAWRQRMEERMQQLERENAELRAATNTIRTTQEALVKDAQQRGILTLDQRPEQTTPEFFDLNKYAAEGD